LLLHIEKVPENNITFLPKDKITITDNKIVLYLLNISHPEGVYKAMVKMKFIW